jgi:hypothetical protein
MNTLNRVLLFILLPIIAILIYPAAWLTPGLLIILIIVVLLALLGLLLWRGRAIALTFAIFLQGMNVIIRMMMFLSHAAPQAGKFDPAFIITSLLGLALSLYLMLRLDAPDIRSTMKA